MFPVSELQLKIPQSFFFRYVREQPDVDFQGATRAKKRQRVPVVLSTREVTRLLELLPTKFRLMGACSMEQVCG